MTWTGNPTGVTMEVSSQFFALSTFSLSNLQGSTLAQQSLLAGYWDLSGIIGGVDNPESFTFTGLQNGSYDVYTYAMSPDNATYFTRVNVNAEAVPGDPDTQVVGGPFSGDFELGVTHSLHTGVSVTDGTLVIHTTDVNFGTLAGIQLRRIVVGDLTGDGSVGVADLLILLSQWGPCPDPDGLSGRSRRQRRGRRAGPPDPPRQLGLRRSGLERTPRCRWMPAFAGMTRKARSS